MAFGIAGSGTGQFREPRGIAVDALGRLYVADFRNHRIVRINDMTGAGWRSLGSEGAEVNQFLMPYSIFVR